MSSSRIRVLVLSSLLAVLAVAAACAPSPDGSQFTLTRRPIINGSVDQSHLSVVALTHPQTGQFCSGTVIANRAVVSAGHCVVEMQKMFQEQGATFRPSDCKVFFGTSVGSSGQSVAVSAAHAHPQYGMLSNGQPVNDVSVWLLAQDAPQPAMAWQQNPLGDISGKTVTLVGYGVTNASQQSGNGTRRTVNAVITGMDDSFIYYGNGYSGTCQGDSGGPMFLTMGGVEVLVGVTSFGDQSCVQEGANARVDAFADFITQYAGASSQPSQPVAVAITSPANGSTQGTSFTVNATITTSAGVSRADLLIDGTVTQTLTVAPWSFGLLGVAQGSHQIKVRAQGNDGGTGEATIQITVGTGAQPTGCSASSPCAAGADCVNGQCVPQQAGGCSSENPCPSGFDCINGQCTAWLQTPGTTGAACTRNTDCDSGICVDGQTGDGYCTQQCATDHDCPHSAVCQQVSGMSLCGAPFSAAPASALATREVGGGCQAAGRAGGPAGAAALLVVALALALRRRDA
ncbi:MAG TPA: trypsin-like serine protease [Polyangia bacterium]|jgi:uncharacterized protein (TIGR03382 family)